MWACRAFFFFFPSYSPSLLGRIRRGGRRTKASPVVTDSPRSLHAFVPCEVEAKQVLYSFSCFGVARNDQWSHITTNDSRVRTTKRRRWRVEFKVLILENPQTFQTRLDSTRWRKRNVHNPRIATLARSLALEQKRCWWSTILGETLLLHLSFFLPIFFSVFCLFIFSSFFFFLALRLVFT